MAMINERPAPNPAAAAAITGQWYNCATLIMEENVANPRAKIG